MKFMTKRGYTGTVRKIVDDECKEVLGVVGTFADLMELGIVKKDTQYSYDTWCCIPAPGRIESWRGTGASREEAINNAIFGKRLG